MALHAIAMMAGAHGAEIEAVAQALVAGGKVRLDLAETELSRLRGTAG
jgi:hydroxymethylglutaryl-CoA reductase